MEAQLQLPPVQATHHLICLGCGHNVDITATYVAPGVITWPRAYCENCPGNPEMFTGGRSGVGLSD